jgi:ATP-binding cassette subfamily B protein
MPSVLARIAGLAMRYPGRMALVGVTSLIGAAASLTLPRLFGRAVDQATHLLAGGAAQAGAAREALLVSAGLVILATSVRGFLAMASSYHAEHLSQKVAYDLRLAFFQQLQRLSFGFHDKIHSGDLITRGMLDLEGARASSRGPCSPR